MDVYVINMGWMYILNWRANEQHVCKNLHIDNNTNFPESNTVGYDTIPKK